MFALGKDNIYWELFLQWASNKLRQLLSKTFFGVTCFPVNLEWGKRSSCHFNSFVNVFMNAINTSFTLLCFWIPLGCGVCQFPRSQETACITQHFTQLCGWALTNSIYRREEWADTTLWQWILMGTNDSFHSKGAPTFSEKRACTQQCGDQEGREAKVKSREVREHQGPRPCKGKPAGDCGHNGLLSSPASR